LLDEGYIVQKTGNTTAAARLLYATPKGEALVGSSRVTDDRINHATQEIDPAARKRSASSCAR